MKKYLIILILLLTGCTKTLEVDNQQDISNNYILFLKTNLSTSLLLYTNNQTTLIELENKNKIYTNNKYKINNLILTDNIITNINYDKKYILKNTITFNDIKITKKDKIIISMNNNNLCIYNININKYGDYTSCDFIYILNNEENVYIKLSEKNKVLFYNEHKTFSKKFLEQIYITWIDTYLISTNNVTKLTLDKNYQIVNI